MPSLTMMLCLRDGVDSGPDLDALIARAVCRTFVYTIVHSFEIETRVLPYHLRVVASLIQVASMCDEYH
jgi:hypothetical protein